MITLAELYRHAADNIEAGRPETHGLEFYDPCDGWRETTCIAVEEIKSSMQSGGTYRIAPKTIRIGDIDVPAPVSAPLEMGQIYYVANLGRHHCDAHIWHNDGFDIQALKRRRIHLTREAAGAHTNALIIISGGKAD